MKNSLFRKLVTGMVSGFMCLTILPTVPTSSSAANVGDKLSVGGGMNQHKGNCDGYSYEVWIDSTGGSGSMTLGKGASFKAEWSANVNAGNFLARRGLDFGSQKKATDYPYIGMDYDADYRQTGSASGNSRLCVYGWFQNKGAGNVPLVEYYIIEDWVDWCPDANGKMVTIDGAQYKIFQMDHTGPTINGGSETFKQYFSVRQDKRTSGHITVSDHFKAWADQGWGIGNLYEVALNAEGWQSSGVADVKMLDVYTDPSQAGGIGGGNVTPTPTPPVEPDASGHYFNDDLTSTASSDWKARGSATLKRTDSGVLVSGRTDSWNGIAKDLDTSAFAPGGTYAFAATVEPADGGSEDFKLTLQCSLDGETQYLEVAAASSKGSKAVLKNNSFTIPAGAKNLVLYVETADSTKDFRLISAIGGVEGSIDIADDNPGNNDPTASGNVVRGDLNKDGKINAYDMVLMRQTVVKGMTGAAADASADIDGDGSVGVADMVLLSKYILGELKKLPAVTTPAATKPPVTTTVKPAETTKPVQGNTNIMEAVKANFTKNVPADVQRGDTGKTEKITYYSKVAGANKSANVWLPSGYDSSKKYNVLYMNHGVFGDESSMLSGFGVREMASNFIQSGDVDPFIIVFPQMYSAAGGGTPSFAGLNMDTMDNYDKFLEDMTDSLMPYIEEKYSVYTGKDHTAIAGFSMGGRESLYLAIRRPDLFGYVCASSPAPGIVPASDNFIANHLGSYKADGTRMTNADFKISASDMPYLLMIGGGTADGVVGTFPKEYHELFTQNGTDHVWQEFPGGGHDASVGLPMFYNFFKYLFKA